MSKVNRWREFSFVKTVSSPEKGIEADLLTRNDEKLAASQIFGADAVRDQQAILAAESEGLAIQED
ncbi:hypothetical protein [Herbaspirillum seropedicae]|uniref:hypothetical protein n=1 Tax=Herbaspirillum seropedicae TaxID=964 RepID=UPI0008482FC6|nr:hypothetical protein [Herbaspirillum seropedicae]AON55769.1 hypothetical protein Hsc_3503 [Herbaspirillum seropedicae]